MNRHMLRPKLAQYMHQKKTKRKPHVFKDEFTTDAANINGTACQPGPGNRYSLDSAGKMSITGGALTVITGGASSDPISSFPAVARAVGKIILFSINVTANRAWFGLANIGNPVAATLSAARRGTLEQNTTNLGVITSNSPTIIVAVVALSTPYKFVIITRAVGQAYFIKGGTFIYWSLLYIDASNSDAIIYPYTSQIGTTTAYKVDYIHELTSLWMPPPLASDSFASAFGVTNGLAHAEGVAGSIGNGGAGRNWVQQVGTWTVASGKAKASALSGGIAIATLALSTKDVLAEVKVTRSAGQGGMVLRYNDINNHLYADHDGTNVFVKQVLAGVTTTLVTGVATYSANAPIRVNLTGTSVRLFYNNSLIGVSSSIDASLTALLHGLHSTDTTVQLDDLLIYAIGVNGEYNIIDALEAENES